MKNKVILITGALTEEKAALVSRVPLKLAGLPEEIAQTILLLASEKSSFISGMSIAVDGGKLAG